MAKKFRRENYIQISGFMITDLLLSGNELLIYAIIYGFSQDGNSQYTGSLSYLESATNSSRNTVISTLKKLTEKKLIIREEIELNNIKFVKYKVSSVKTELPVQSLNLGSAISDEGSAETEPNNTNNNKEINNNNNSDFFKEEEEEKPKPKYTNRHFKKDLIEYGFNPDLVDEWMQVRKNKRATNSKTAFNKFINQVELNGNDKNFILETCIAKSWGSFEASYNLGSNVPNKVVAPNNQVSKQIDPLEYFGYELNPDFNVR